MGSEKVAVHIHGSMLVGMGTDGIKKETDTSLWETPPSDIDFLVFVGEKDENEQKYQEKYSEKDKDMNDDSKEEERIFRFIEDDKMENRLQKNLGRRGDGMIVRVPELIEQIREICAKLSNNQEPTNEELISIYKTSILFGSDAVFQDKNDTEAMWRNEILKILLENPSGKVVWNGIRDYFNLYLANYEENPMATSHLDEIKKDHKKRAGLAYEKILSEMNVQQDRKEIATNSLKKQRSKIQLPDFQAIQSLKEKLY